MKLRALLARRGHRRCPAAARASPTTRPVAARRSGGAQRRAAAAAIARSSPRSGPATGRAPRRGSTRCATGRSTHAARAELYPRQGLAARSSSTELMALLAQAPDMPKAEQLARLATTRGATELPDLPPAAEPGLGWAASRAAPAPQSVKGDPAAAELEPLVQPLIVDNRPSEAEASARRARGRARPRGAHRIPAAHRLVLLHRSATTRDARRLADAGPRAAAANGRCTAPGSSGLAAWRMGDCNAAADAFATRRRPRPSDVELIAAGHYWAARADMMCGRPERVQARLAHRRPASRRPSTA